MVCDEHASHSFPYCIHSCAACIALRVLCDACQSDCLFWCCHVLPCAVLQAPDDEPVCRQLLRLLLDDSDPVVAQQAAAALAQ